MCAASDYYAILRKSFHERNPDPISDWKFRRILQIARRRHWRRPRRLCGRFPRGRSRHASHPNPDPEANPGGVCLYRGCIPSKALLHVAKLLDESQHAKNWGVEFPPAQIDLAKLRTWKEGVVKKLTGGLGQLSKQRHVEYIRGQAAFENSTTLRVSKTDSSETLITIRSHHHCDRLTPLRHSCIQTRFAAHHGLNRRPESSKTFPAVY